MALRPIMLKVHYIATIKLHHLHAQVQYLVTILELLLKMKIEDVFLKTTEITIEENRDYLREGSMYGR